MTFTAGSKLRASDLVAIDPRGSFSRYTSTTSITAAATTVLTPTLAQGNGTGLSLATNLFTLASGIWIVDFGWQSTLLGSTILTSLDLAISSDATASITSGWITGGAATANSTGANFVTGSCSTKILSDGTSTVAFKVFSPTSGPTGSAGTVRITFSMQSNSN